LNAEEFVHIVKLRTSDAAVKNTLTILENPSGRSPSPGVIALSRWYHGLSDSDRNMLRRALEESAASAIFGFFCILDGVRVIEDTPEKGELELYFVKGAEKNLLNSSHQEELHNLFNALRENDTHV